MNACEKFRALAEKAAATVYGGDFTKGWNATRATHPELYDEMVGDRAALENSVSLNERERRQSEAWRAAARAYPIQTPALAVLGGGAWNTWNESTRQRPMGSKAQVVVEALVRKYQEADKSTYPQAFAKVKKLFPDLFGAMNIPDDIGEEALANEHERQVALAMAAAVGVRRHEIALTNAVAEKARQPLSARAKEISGGKQVVHWSRVVDKSVWETFPPQQQLHPTGTYASKIIGLLVHNVVEKGNGTVTSPAAMAAIEELYPELFSGEQEREAGTTGQTAGQPV